MLVTSLRDHCVSGRHILKTTDYANIWLSSRNIWSHYLSCHSMVTWSRASLLLCVSYFSTSDLDVHTGIRFWVPECRWCSHLATIPEPIQCMQEHESVHVTLQLDPVVAKKEKPTIGTKHKRYCPFGRAKEIRAAYQPIFFFSFGPVSLYHGRR